MSGEPILVEEIAARQQDLIVGFGVILVSIDESSLLRMLLEIFFFFLVYFIQFRFGFCVTSLILRFYREFKTFYFLSELCLRLATD
jgi:hypothetical protein